jgi:hypothetical protein
MCLYHLISSTHFYCLENIYVRWWWILASAMGNMLLYYVEKSPVFAVEKEKRIL